MSHEISRRQFVKESALAATAAATVAGLAYRPLAAAEQSGWPRPAPVKIHVAYLGLAGPWPRPDFDAKAEATKFQQRLAGVSERLGDIEFVGGELIPNTEAAAAELLPKLAGADALLIIHLSFGHGGPMRKLIAAGLPTVIFSQPFSGHDWMHAVQAQKEGDKAVLLASRDWSELDRAALLLRVPARMRQSRIILIGRPQGTEPARSAELVRQRIGPTVVPLSTAEFDEIYQAVSPEAAAAEAEEYWIKPARKIVEPSREEIVRSARVYLAIKQAMIRENAQAITIHCLSGFQNAKYGYPCLAFSKLNDLGMVGACEADVDSTLTMLLGRHAFGKPGFITDPMFDLSKNAVIHAHCVAATKMDGPAGRRAPFDIRSHSEDNKGAALEVDMRIGQEITCAKLCNLDTVLLSAQKIVEIPDHDDRGCRTQCTAEVADARAMMTGWGSGVLDKANMMSMLHRVVFYGNHVENIRYLAQLMGLKIVMEG